MSNIHRLHPHSHTRKTSRSLKRKDNAQNEAVAKELLGWLFETLSEQFPTMDEESISEAVTGAYRYHLNNSADFDSADGLPLEFYLLYSATRKLRSRLPLREAA